MTEQLPTENAPRKEVFAIIERPASMGDYWLRIGFARKNKDGSENVYLDALPLNGKLQIRNAPPKDKAAAVVEPTPEPTR